MYGYIYKTTCFITGKIYVGQHGGSEFTQKYLGSGILLVKDVKKFGRENFTVELIDSADSAEELSAKEKYWISALDAQNPDVGYNLSAGGPYGARGWHHSSETRRLISISSSGKTPWIAGKHHTEATKEKWKSQRFGVHWMNDGVSSHRVRPEDVERRIAQGWTLGRLSFRTNYVFTQEHKRQLSLAIKGRHISVRAKINVSLGGRGLTFSQALEKGMRVWRNGDSFSVSLRPPTQSSSWEDVTDDVLHSDYVSQLKW